MRLLTALLAVRVARPHVDGIMGVSCVNSSRAGDVVCGVANSATGSSCMLRLTRADDDARYRLSQSTPLAQWDSNPHGVLLERRRSAVGDGDDDGDGDGDASGLRLVVAVSSLGLVVELDTAEAADGAFAVPPPAGAAASARDGAANATRVLAAFGPREYPYYFAPADAGALLVSLEGNGTVAAVARARAPRRLAPGGSLFKPRGLARAAATDEAGERDGAGCALGVANHTDIFELCGAGRLAEVARLPRASAAAAVPRDFHQIARAPGAGAGAYALLDADNGAVYLWRRAEPERLELVAGAANASSGFCDGARAAARFHAPHGLAPLDAEAVVVADTGNCALRRVVVAGARFGDVTTIAHFAANDTCGGCVASGRTYRYGNCSECACGAGADGRAAAERARLDARVDDPARAAASPFARAIGGGSAAVAVLVGVVVFAKRRRGYRAVA